MEAFRQRMLTLVHAILVLLCCQNGHANNNATDRLSLLSIKSHISSDPLGALISWNDSHHFCNWAGVTCGGRLHPQRVTSLELDSLQLAGPISPSLANLTFLRKLSLSNNLFYGQISFKLDLLVRLRHLNLSTNPLEGGLPMALANCSHLRNISLKNDNFQGRIPPELGGCSHLQVLELGNNVLTGDIPPSLGNLSSLSILRLGQNALSGSIPPSIGNLVSLTSLNLAFNNLTGVIPPSLWNVSSLTSFAVASNQLSGELPQYVGPNLPRLEYLYMSQNRFHGAIPASLSNASLLEGIDLSTNNLTGAIPSCFGVLQGLSWLHLQFNQLEVKKAGDWNFLAALTNCSNLRELLLDNNMIGGMLPKSIANLSTHLEWLTVSGNQILGAIPEQIGNLINLTTIYLGNNLLTGNIPASIGRLQKLNILGLDRNNLAGKIPSSFRNLTQLNELYLDYNSLSGSIPASLGNCRSLTFLNLQNNNLSGAIPKQVLSIFSLSEGLYFSYNSLTGPLPPEVARLKNLNTLDVSGNKLSGEIPSSLGECTVLEYLYMKGNLFHGEIPSSLLSLRGLQVLDLSSNNLTGTIPEFFENFTFLQLLNLSFNNLEGEVPRHGIFSNATAISVLGNDKLCGGNSFLHLPSCSRQTRSSRSSTKVIAIVSAIICFIFAICFCSTWYWKHTSSQKSLLMSSTIAQNINISFAKLVQMTDGFSAANLIGVGSYSSVYKGKCEGKVAVAVKVLKLGQRGASKSFIAECEALRNIRHRNILKILTACSSVDFEGNDFKALIYEYMPNGNLETWLHPNADELCETKTLSLIQRLNVAIDVASALDYLHHYSHIPLVHCDLKPSNILLDDDMTAHVADFGLARFLVSPASKPSLTSTSSSCLRGSIGYVAPEYGMGNNVSTHGDAYSYGILLLELFTGKRPTDETLKEGLSLRAYVDMVYPDRVMEIMDEHLILEEEDDRESVIDDQSIYRARERAHQCVASMLRVGLQCSHQSPMERTQMGNVIRELHATRDKFLETGMPGDWRSTAPPKE